MVGPDHDPDKYRLRRHIGAGEAELWEGDVLLAGGPEPVAVKILRTEHAGDVQRWRQRWAEQVDYTYVRGQRPGAR